MRSTGKLGYTYKKHKDLGWKARLVNPGLSSIDIALLDVSSGVLYALHLEGMDADNKPKFDIVDLGFPSKEFITAVRDSRSEGGGPIVPISVMEQGIAYADDADAKTYPAQLLLLEDSNVKSFEYKGYDGSYHEYSVVLENGHGFTLGAHSELSEESMRKIGFAGTSIGIDNVIWDIFGPIKDVKINRQSKDFIENLERRYEYFYEIYFDANKMIDLTEMELKILSGNNNYLSEYY